MWPDSCLPAWEWITPLWTTSRSGAVVARWAHNPKVVSSSLASATIQRLFLSKRQPFSFFMRSLPSSPSSRRRTECSFFLCQSHWKKSLLEDRPAIRYWFFFLHAHIYIMRCKKKIRYARLLRKNKGTCVKISLPVPINFVARGFKFCCPSF